MCLSRSEGKLVAEASEGMRESKAGGIKNVVRGAVNAESRDLEEKGDKADAMQCSDRREEEVESAGR